MRSCASLGARSPGRARKSSSCSRSWRVRWCMEVPARRSAARVAGGRRNVGAMALCRQHGADARVGSGRLGASIHPDLQVLDAIDDATAELRIAGSGAVDPVLLEGADGKADEPCGLGRTQIALRQAGEI